MQMTVSEIAELDRLEKVIESGFTHFTEVGNAFLEIRDKKLYRRDYDTFEAYCREEWSMSTKYARNLMESTLAVQSLPQEMAAMAATERVARAVAKAPAQDRPKVIEAVIAKGEPITAKAIKAEVAKLPAPMKNGEHKQPVDETGFPLTKTALVYWNRKHEIQELMSQINGLKAHFDRIADQRDKLYNGLQFDSVDASLTDVLNNLMNARPYAVCWQCGGHPEHQPDSRCTLCHSKAMISRWQWDRLTPETIKTVREKQRSK